MKKTFTTLVVSLSINVFAQFPTFTDVISSSGLTANQGKILDILDYDNDGFDDLIYQNGVQTLTLMKNSGTGTFIDVTASAGMPSNITTDKVISSDFNNDGFIDILIWNDGSFRFFENNINNQFTEKTTVYGITNPLLATGYHLNDDVLLLCDYDKDGDNDIVITRKMGNNTRSISVIENKINNGGTFNSFVDLVAGIASNIDPVISLIDYDADSDADLIMNMRPNTSGPVGSGNWFNLNPIKMYQNNGGIFSDVTSSVGLSSVNVNHLGFVNVLDLNNDGLMDFLVGTTDATYANYNNNKNRYFKNNGNNTFTDYTSNINLYNRYGYYANSTVADLDNDRKFELIWEYASATDNAIQIFRDSSGVYKERTSDFGLNTFYTSGGSYGNSLSVFDFDNDGDLDVFYNKMGTTNSLFLKNNGVNNKFLKIKLKGCTSSKDPRGATVFVYNSGVVNAQYYSSNNNSSSRFINKSESETIHFGMGNKVSADSVIVKWPSGNKTKLTNVSSNQTIVVLENPNGNCGPCTNGSTIYSTITQTYFDTVLVSVTDTLIINTTVTGLTPPNNVNTIKVWPNPTNDHITIDNGNIVNLTGYQVKITNSLSQQVFQSAITQQQFYIDLSSWTGNGIYFVHIIDGQGNTVDIRKIVLQ